MDFEKFEKKEYFVNRELSWLKFDERVLSEARDKNLPLFDRLKFLSITGPKADIDRVVDTYLSRYEIHLENALSELKTVKDLRPYIETNPYKEKLNIALSLIHI